MILFRFLYLPKITSLRDDFSSFSITRIPPKAVLCLSPHYQKICIGLHCQHPLTLKRNTFVSFPLIAERDKKVSSDHPSKQFLRQFIKCSFNEVIMNVSRYNEQLLAKKYNYHKILSKEIAHLSLRLKLPFNVNYFAQGTAHYTICKVKLSHYYPKEVV